MTDDDLTQRLRDNAEVLRRYFPSTTTTVIAVSRLQDNANAQAEAADHIDAQEATIAKLREAIVRASTTLFDDDECGRACHARLTDLWAALSDTEGT